MEHSEAIKKMASERYLLGELAPDEVDAFEEHMFACPVCALDVRAADAFMQQAKAELSLSAAPARHADALVGSKSARKSLLSFLSWRPIFAAPVFASMLGIIAYQNLATIPRLRSETVEPRIAPWASLHLGARGAAASPLLADRSQGAVLLLQLPQTWNFPRYQFDFYDAGSKLVWSRSVSVAAQADRSTLSVVIPPTGLQSASYTLAVSGISAQGERTELDRRALAIHFDP